MARKCEGCGKPATTKDVEGVSLCEACHDAAPHSDECKCPPCMDARIATLEAELLRVRTTGHGAAHELDNIAVECGLGHSPKPGDVAAHVRQLREAVRVLADECFTANTTITGNAVCHAQIVNCHAGSYRKWTAAQSRTDANPIASAAITDAAKAMEG